MDVWLWFFLGNVIAVGWCWPFDMIKCVKELSFSQHSWVYIKEATRLRRRRRTIYKELEGYRQEQREMKLDGCVSVSPPSSSSSLDVTDMSNVSPNGSCHRLDKRIFLYYTRSYYSSSLTTQWSSCDVNGHRKKLLLDDFEYNKRGSQNCPSPFYTYLQMILRLYTV